jgi:hypothetical protein
VIFASGLKYVGVGTTALGWILCGVLLAAASLWLASARPWRREEELAASEKDVTPTEELASSLPD